MVRQVEVRMSGWGWVDRQVVSFFVMAYIEVYGRCMLPMA